MKLWALSLVLLSQFVFAVDAPKPTNRLKVYKGPEGEVIGMAEVNGGKEMLVYFKNIDPAYDGKSRVYLVGNEGPERQYLYTNVKKGSKTHQSRILEQHGKTWMLYHPVKWGTHLDFSYSEKETENMKIDDVVAAFQH